MSLFHKSSNLPQSKYSDLVRSEAKKEVVKYMISQGADSHGLKELASSIVDDCISNKLNEIRKAYDNQGSLPSVFINDRDKQSALVNNAIRSIEDLDSTGELEQMMAKIHLDIDYITYTCKDD